MSQLARPYVRFELSDQQKPKTHVWNVLSRSSDDLLGTIKWYAPWRQYVFFPEAETLYSSGCLAYIQKFVRSANSRQKQHQLVQISQVA
jgi:hypothetical protein